MSDIADTIASGRAVLGIELGSTRIKAVPDRGDDPSIVLATGSHEWENELVDGMWTYSLDAVWAGLRSAYADLVADVARRYAVTVRGFGAVGVSAMMHGYLAFDEAGELLVPFRTWRNTTTGPAAAELTGLFGVNIPLRWSIAHLHQAVLDAEPHVPRIRSLTTLAGYVHETAHRPPGARRRRCVRDVPDRPGDPRLRRRLAGPVRPTRRGCRCRCRFASCCRMCSSRASPRAN